MKQFSLMIQCLASFALSNDFVTPTSSIFRTFQQHILYIIAFAVVSIAAIIIVVVNYYKKRK